MTRSKPCECASSALCYLGNSVNQSPAQGQEIAAAEKIPVPVQVQRLLDKGKTHENRSVISMIRRCPAPKVVPLYQKLERLPLHPRGTVG
jgi:hypothetical protein